MKLFHIMTKKTAYDLFSYVTDDNLIFYKNRKKKSPYLAFSIFRTSEIDCIIKTLLTFLKKGYLFYFSLEIRGENEDFIFILNFQDKDKNFINKMYNLIIQEVSSKTKIDILKKQELENVFFSLDLIRMEPDFKINKKEHSFILEKGINSYQIDLFDVSIRKSIAHKHFLFNLLKVIHNFTRSGSINIIFQKNQKNNIIFSVYHINIHKNDDSDKNHLEQKVNNIYNYHILEKSSLKIREIFRIICRYKISNLNYLLEDHRELFSRNGKSNIYNLEQYNLKIEGILLDNKINFKRINKNILLIFEKILFLVQNKIDYNLISKILKKYYSTYIICILMLKEQDYKKLLNFEKINLIKTIIILNPKKFLIRKIPDVIEKLKLEDT